MASCFPLQLAAVRWLASSVQSHACPLVGRVSSQQPHHFFFLRLYSCVWLWHSGAYPWPHRTSTTLCCLAFLWLLPFIYKFKKCPACLGRCLMRLCLSGCQPPVFSFSRGRSLFCWTPGLSSTVSCCLLLGSGKALLACPLPHRQLPWPRYWRIFIAHVSWVAPGWRGFSGLC